MSKLSIQEIRVKSFVTMVTSNGIRGGVKTGVNGQCAANKEAEKYVNDGVMRAGALNGSGEMQCDTGQ